MTAMGRLQAAFFSSTFLPRAFHALPKRPLQCRSRFATVASIRPKVSIVGGGFGGLSTALRLESMPWTRLTRPEITIIDKSDRFAFLPMLYEVATNEAESWEIAPPFADLLQETSIKFIRAKVDAIDTTNDIIEGATIDHARSSGVSVPFDRAVISIGSETANIDRVLGAREHALPFYTFNDSMTLRERLRAIMDEKLPNSVINVVVVGGGYSGVELASCVSEKLGNQGAVTLVERGDRILKSASSHNRVSAEQVLQRNGVIIEYRKDVIEVTFDTISLKLVHGDSAGPIEKLAADLVIWTAGSKPCTVLSGYDVPLNEKGRVVADEYLQVAGKEDKLYTLGDVAASPVAATYFGTAQVAAQQSEYVAYNIWASLTGERKLRYNYAHLGEMMVLGAHNATVSSPLGVEATGKAAWAMRRVAYLARMPTDRHRMRVAASWAADPLLRGISKAAAEARRRSGITEENRS